jgi:hypothetical protein
LTLIDPEKSHRNIRVVELKTCYGRELVCGT